MKIPTLSKNQWMWMIVTLVIYGLMMGWPLAVAMVFTIAFHEYCHLLMASKLGMKTQGFTMIPFVGGMAFVPSGYKTLWRQAQVVFAGPIGGGLMSFITFGVYLLTGMPFLGAVAFWMGVMNLFNLLPISFMDGGLLMNTISYSINRKLGLYIMVTSTMIGSILISFFAPILSIFILIFGIMHCYREYNNQKNEASGKTWLCTKDFLNKPFPMNKKEITKVSLIWSSSVVILSIYCFLLYHTPLSNITTLLAH
jgi:Zn-dependent protease